MSRFASAILILVCAAAFTAALPASAYASIMVDEEEVVFRFEYHGTSKVFLTGDFNNWNPTMDGMVKRDGAWELRLYLVPGKYRYMFVVEGENIPDPDNPNRDPDGNTFFIFVEEDGVYDIVYEVTESGERKIEENYTPYGALSAVAVSDYGLFTASAGVKGDIDGSLRGNILIGAEYETTARDPIKAYLVRAKGEWVTDRFQLGAFHRSGRIGFDDPLSLFTDVGPFAYPLDLFCRGVEASAGWKGSIEARAFFANRIDGYRSGLETDEWEMPPESEGDPEDRDMIGLSMKGVLGPVLLGYMYRFDRGPDLNYWMCDECIIRGGFESRTSHGVMLELKKKEYPVFRTQYLTGRTRLRASSVLLSMPPEPGASLSDYDRDWEDGYRVLADLSWTRGAFFGMFGWHRTTIERNSYLLRWSGWESADTDVFEALVTFETKSFKVDLGIDLEDFGGDGGMGRTLWLQRENFWLDGDRLRSGMLLFLDSEKVWKVRLQVEETGVEQISGPYRLEGHLSATARWDGNTDSRMFEITGGKGIRAGSFLSFHADLRYAAYRHEWWTGDSGFFNAWAGVRGSLGGTGWAALGAGVPPHRFDRWHYDFTGDGREHYLLEQDLIDTGYPLGTWSAIYSLGEAEKSLSEEWRLSFEAGFSF